MNQSSDFDFDVIVVGGGPAGSTAAALLARRGWRVGLLERERFPRFQVGESLLPFNNDLFRDLGILDELDRGGFVDKRGAEFLTADGTHRQKFVFGQNLKPGYERSYQVRRSEFDHILLRKARESGAAVTEQARVTAVDLSSDDRASVTWTGAAGREHRTTGRFLLDATGAQGRVMAGIVRRDERDELRKISIFAHYEGVRPADDGSLDITITLFRNGWAWLIPIDATTSSLGIVLDAESWKRSGRTKEEALSDTIAESPYLTARFEGAHRVSEVWARKNFSYSSEPIAGKNFALIGDAAGFIDPIFSTGVFIAMKGAEMAASAVEERLRSGSIRDLMRYQRKMRVVLRRYLRIISYFYRREFIEVFLHPQPHLGLVQVVVGLLAGNAFETVLSRWKLELFYLLVRIQKERPVVAPSIPWDKLPLVGGERVSEVNVV